MPWSSAAWIAAIDSLSSCGPQLNFPFGPPIAQAPKPIVVSCGPCDPSCRCSIDAVSFTFNVLLACGSKVLPLSVQRRRAPGGAHACAEQKEVGLSLAGVMTYSLCIVFRP